MRRCSAPSSIRLEGVFSDKVFSDKAGNFVDSSRSFGKTTLTAEDGRVVVVQFANAVFEGQQMRRRENQHDLRS